MSTYEVFAEGASQAIAADTLAEAIEQAEGWLREGEEATEGTMWVHGWLIERYGENEIEYRVRATVDPQEPACTADEHDWQAPLKLVGGCKESPGVYGHGGGVTIHEVCLRCGCGRVTDTWAQDPTTGQQGLRSVEYRKAEYRREVEAMRKYEIQTLDHGMWTSDLGEDVNEFASEAEALEGIEELKKLGDDWASAEYRVMPKGEDR